MWGAGTRFPWTVGSVVKHLYSSNRPEPLRKFVRGIRTAPSQNGVKSRLTVQQINQILRLREASSTDFELCAPIKSFEASQLAANFPIEDRCYEARFLRTGGMVFAVIDGHGGPGCGQALQERLADYVAISVMDSEALSRLLKEIDDALDHSTEFPSIVKRSLHPGDYFIPSQRETHQHRLRNYVSDRLEFPEEEFDIPSQIRQAFLRLDNDLSFSGLETIGPDGRLAENANLENLASSLSGAVVCLAYISECDLYVASTGDCAGFVSSKDGEGLWITKTLAQRHTHEDESEVKRLWKNHPGEEKTVIQGERLLGALYPLRAFGDCQYKWPSDKLRKILKQHQLMHLMPYNYQTPPYLTAEPTIIHRRLQATDKFLMLTTDGLLDFVDADGAAQLVIEHSQGRRALEPFMLNKNSGLTLAELNAMLKKRSIAQVKKPDDPNVATHVIRHTLGRTQVGLDMNKLSKALSASVEEARYQRDDMTVQVIFFDTDYLRLFSPMES